MYGIEGAYSENRAFESASSYAESISFHQRFRKMMGLPVTSRDVDQLPEKIEEAFWEFTANNFWGDNTRPFIDYLLSSGWTLNKIRQVYEETKKEKGVVIGYSGKILENGFALPGNDGYDIRVMDVKIDAILGLEPLDDKTYGFLDNLL